MALIISINSSKNGRLNFSDPPPPTPPLNIYQSSYIPFYAFKTPNESLELSHMKKKQAFVICFICFGVFYLSAVMQQNGSFF